MFSLIYQSAEQENYRNIQTVEQRVHSFLRLTYYKISNRCALLKAHVDLDNMWSAADHMTHTWSSISSHLRSEAGGRKQAAATCQ